MGSDTAAHRVAFVVGTVLLLAQHMAAEGIVIRSAIFNQAT